MEDQEKKTLLRSRTPLDGMLEGDDPHNVNLYLQDATFEVKCLVALIGELESIETKDLENGLKLLCSIIEDRLEDINTVHRHLHGIIDNSASNQSRLRKAA